MNPYLLFPLCALGFAIFEMAVTWMLARRWSNYGVVDVVWSAGFAPIAIGYWVGAACRAYDTKLNGFPEWSFFRALVLVLMVVFWSIRLAWHLGHRVKKHHPIEDVRYARLRLKWGASAPFRMFVFFLLQGVLQVFLSFPFLFACLNVRIPVRSNPFALLETLSIMTWLVGLIGESIADAQLDHFRSNPSNRGKVCRTGLWAWSRHPNYFFEWIIWVAYWLYACGSPGGGSSFFAPALIFVFLTRVTGIPMTEALSIESKGEAYRDYQRCTSAFVPWPPSRYKSKRL